MLNISYEEPSTWIEYANQDLNCLCEVSIRLVSIGDWIMKHIRERDLSEIIHDLAVLKILFGGLREPKDVYDVKTLACWYSSLYSLDLNYREVFDRLEMGFTIDEACTGITVNVRPEIFNLFPRRAIIPLLRRLLTLFEELAGKKVGKELSIRNWRKIREEAVREVKGKPEVLVDLVHQLVQSVLNISPLRNERSFFIVSTHTLPYYYVIGAYSKLKEEKIFRTLRKVLGFDIIFKPQISSETLRKEYTMVGYPRGSTGYIMLKIISEALKIPSMEISEKPLSEIFNITDDRLKYLEEAINSLFLTNIFREEMRDIIDSMRYVGSRLEVNESMGVLELYAPPPTLKTIALKGNLTIRGVTSTIHYGDKFTNINLLKFIDFMAPQLFLGIAMFRGIGEGNVYEWQAIIPIE